ncbi:hypothetical protein K227x_02760 [Rubripirellula lacrimiformis]|uniref:Uncharacterized protein n=1 Tax=Rubripirellula lacrimiformis TaxID=1930273 RepID=A0A517N444_9BACT|nr:hypothetical protein [Rubripirellula lacrimiformis]QDT01907.1 hypothetical protein K227x_02760 [Rubripirellula lacrimiformis]
MPLSNNPYQPPRPTDPSDASNSDDDTTIQIDGQTTIDDVSKLIHVPIPVVVLRYVVGLVCVPMFIGIGSFIVFAAKSLADLIPMLLLQGFLIAIAWFAFSWLGRRSRTKRLLKHHPELVGVIHGRLDGFGLHYIGPAVEQCREISWSAFLPVYVSRHGMRLNWKHSPQHFLVVPASALDAIAPAHLKTIVRQLQNACQQPPIFAVPEDWGGMPAGAITFRGTVPMETVSLPLHHPIYIASAAAMAVMLYQATKFTLITLGVATAAGVVSHFAAKRNRTTVMPLQIAQWGWFTPDGGQFHSPYFSTIFLWTDLVRVDLNDEKILVDVDSKFQFAIESQDMESDQWSRTQSWIRQARPSPLPVH